MKILLLSLLVMLGLSKLSAQETHNFYIENGSLIWQKVYETKLSAENIIRELKTGGYVKNIEFSENFATGEMDVDVNYKSAGYSEMLIPMYIPRNNVVCSAVIDFKEGRYRVTLKNIRLKATMEDPVTKIGETASLETFALKKGNTAFRAPFLKEPAIIYNYTFIEIFKVKEKTKEDNW